MAISDPLFSLIKSLTKGEKRYFRINTEKTSNYIKLFNFIERQKKYDEKQIKTKHKKAAFNAQLPVTKNYLYHLVLKQLRAFNEPKSIQAKIKNLLLESDILQQKGLYKQSEQLLKKAKKIALSYDNSLAIIEILNKQLTNAISDNAKKKEKVIDALHEEVFQSIEDLKKEQTLSQLNQQFFITFLKGKKEREADFWNNLEAKMQHPILQEEAVLTTFTAKYLFHNIKGLYYRLKGDLKQSKMHQEIVVLLWEQSPHQIKELPHLYRIYLGNYLNICHANKAYDEFPPLLEKLTQLPTRTFDEAAETFQDLTHLQILYYMNTAQFGESIRIIPMIKEGMEKYKAKISIGRQFSFSINIAIMFFAAEEYDEALYWVTNIVNRTRVEQRQDIQRFARILQLVLHLELGNDRMLDYLYENVYRNLRYKVKPNAFEKVALENIKGIFYATSRKMRLQAYETFEMQLSGLTDEQNKRKELGIEELELWVRSKLEGCSFKEMLLM